MAVNFNDLFLNKEINDSSASVYIGLALAQDKKAA